MTPFPSFMNLGSSQGTALPLPCSSVSAGKTCAPHCYPPCEPLVLRVMGPKSDPGRIACPAQAKGRAEGPGPLEPGPTNLSSVHGPLQIADRQQLDLIPTESRAFAADLVDTETNMRSVYTARVNLGILKHCPLFGMS